MQIKNYKILDIIDKEGKGIIYKAIDENTKQEHAIKQLTQKAFDDPKMRDRFVREVNILSNMDHPNIVKVYDFFEENNTLNLVMEWVDGLSFYDAFLKNRMGLPHQKIIDIFKKIVQTLAYVYSRNIKRIDPYPGFLMLTPTLDFKFINLGCVREDEIKFKPGIKLKEFYFLSPEIILNKPADILSDIYSFGLILFTMFTNSLPKKFKAATQEYQIMNEIVMNNIEDVREYNDKIPEWIADLIKKAIDKDTTQRIQSLKEFWVLLQNKPKIIIPDTEIDNIVKEATFSNKQGLTYCIRSVSFNPDGNLIAYGSNDGKVTIRKTYSGEIVAVLEGHSDWVNSVSFSKDGKYLVSGSWDEKIILWDAIGYKKINEIAGHWNNINEVKFSPDSKLLASASLDSTIKIWDVETLENVLVLRGHKDGITAIDFSFDSEFLASASLDGNIRIWDLFSGECLKIITNAHQESITSIAFSPDGKYLASGGKDNLLKIWDVENGEIVKEYKEFEEHISSVMFMPNGYYLFAASWDGKIKVINYKTDKLFKVLSDHIDGVLSIDISKNGRKFASGSLDESIILWDIQLVEYVKTKGHNDVVRQVIFYPKGEALVSCSRDSSIKIWEAKTGLLKKSIWEHKGDITSIDIDKNCKFLISGAADGTIKIFDLDNGKIIRNIIEHTGIVSKLKVFNNNDNFLSVSNDKSIIIRNITPGNTLSNVKTNSAITCVDINLDDTLIVIGNLDQTIKIMDLNKKTIIKTFTGHNKAVSDVKFTSDDKIISCSYDKNIFVWDIRFSDPILKLTAHKDIISAIDMHPTKNILVSASWDKSIIIWNLNDGSILDRISNFGDGINSISFDIDGKLLAIGLKDGSVKALKFGDYNV
ncbi:MAG TPA: protein kinase [Ignavibacteriales bacterium]|nr:protein kinase [Ignavibacteriales bacterium]HRR18892.1 protein kinase [Ignavibacteriales bacterium]HRT98638.1 protein kinase [Ignavibacteriales bacterium]